MHFDVGSESGPSSEQEQAFTVLSDEELHSWSVFRLLERRVSSKGAIFERTFVSSPGAVGVVAIDSHENIVLVEQYRPSLDAWLLEIPAGIRDIVDEPILGTAQRELLEETGYVADAWRRLGRCVGSAAVTNSSVELFEATDLRVETRRPHGPEEEAMKVLLLPLREAVARVLDGRIVDAKTSIGILLLVQQRKSAWES